jgi:peptidoglycan/xylan/chitin deacetylase (PgdA/CDA1 family)
MAFTDHCYKLPLIADEKHKIDEITKTQKILKDVTGIVPKYFRYPGLCHSDRDDQLVTNLGLKVNQNDLSSGDAFARDAVRIVNNVVRQARSGSVVVMHMGGDNAKATTGALKLLVPKLKDKGFVFDSLR